MIYKKKIKSLRFILGILVFLFGFTIIEKMQVEAAAECVILYEGKSGDMEWSINSDGLLYISGEGQFKTSDGGFLVADKYGCEFLERTVRGGWETYSDEIKSAKVSISGVELIGGLFAGLNNLSTVEFVDCDLSDVIAASAMFYNCSSLKSVNWNGCRMDNVIVINQMFYNCTSLKTIDLSNMSFSEGTSCQELFSDCYQLEEIKGIDKWNMYNVVKVSCMFSSCKMLTSIDLSNVNFSHKLKSMNSMFYNCENLKNVYLQAEIKNTELEIGTGMFSESGIQSFVVPKGIVGIGFGAFRNCDYLETVILPDSIKYIDFQAFAYCNKLSSVSIPNKVETIGYQAFSCTGITEVILPESVVKIEDRAFDGCYNMKKFIAGENLKIIGKQIIDSWYQPKIYGEYRSIFDKYCSVYDLDFAPLNKLDAYQLLVTEDELTLCYYMDISSETADEENISFVCEYDGETYETAEYIDTENGLRYACKVPLDNIETDINSYVEIGDRRYSVSTYSVKMYLEEIISNPVYESYRDIAVELLNNY